MNSTTLFGRIATDITVRETQAGEMVARYNLAVNRSKQPNGETNTDFIPCVCFGKMADVASKWLKKGNRILVQGSIRTGSYTTKHGDKARSFEVIVTKQHFIDTVNKDRTPEPENPFAEENSDDFMDMSDYPSEEEFPFRGL